MTRIAYFITPHGFGHAARSSAIMDAVSETVPLVSFDIFTTAPEWFFADSLSGQFEYHEFVTDIGLVQKTPFLHDLKETIEALDRFIPFDSALISETADFLKQRTCQLVVCDISPIGISIAKEAGIPSVLIENFTWDWIYEDFIQADARISRYAEFFRKIYQAADYHIQASPVCNPQSVDMTTDPISRNVRRSSVGIREKLGIPQEKKIVLLTTGGVREKYRFLENLTAEPEICFVIPGGSESPEQQDNLILLPYRSGFNHAELVNAADAVVGKAGYSTIAEVYQAGVPFGYVPRSNFRETDKLVAFVEKEMTGLCIGDEEFKAGKWLSKVSQLLSFPKTQRHHRNGSHQAADLIRDILFSFKI
jgi:UDP:flavonoid glycosyltransferase YjiC (YdhE family)